MKTKDGKTFHGQTLFWLGRDLDGTFHMETCHHPTIDTDHMIWSLYWSDGAKVSFGKLCDHFSSAETAAGLVIQALEAKKAAIERALESKKSVIDRDLTKWRAVANPPVPPGHVPYACKHLARHEGFLSLDPYEIAWRNWFRGYLICGYCYLHYPQYLRESWAKDHAPTIGEGI